MLQRRGLFTDEPQGSLEQASTQAPQPVSFIEVLHGAAQRPTVEGRQFGFEFGHRRDAFVPIPGPASSNEEFSIPPLGRKQA